MPQSGFIHEKIEIKFLILYLASRLIEPVPFEAMQELALCDGGVDFFEFSEALHDLVVSEHLSLSAGGLYAVTEKGRRNSSACESSLPYTVRLHADKILTIFNQKLKRQSQVHAEIAPRPNGTYTVSLAFRDDDDANILKMELMVPVEPMARDLAERFDRNPERLYNGILNVLFDDGDK